MQAAQRKNDGRVGLPLNRAECAHSQASKSWLAGVLVCGDGVARKDSASLSVEKVL